MGFLDFCLVAIGVLALCAIATAVEDIGDQLALLRELLEEDDAD